MLCRLSYFIVCISCVFVCGAEEIPEKVRFNEHVRSILSDKCFHCHGPDEKTIKGKLQLHTFEKATGNLSKKGKRFAIVPGSVKESTLWERINTTDQDDIMPPPESHKTLNAYEKAVLKKWIEQGAEYEDHWAFIPKPEEIKNKQSPHKYISILIQVFYTANNYRSDLRGAHYRGPLFKIHMLK